MKRLLLITLLIGYIYPCVAQDKPIRTEESLEGTVIYKKTTTFEVDGYTYQCDVDDGSQFVTLYNKENKLTYEKIVYKDTGKTYIGSWSSNVIEYDRFMSQQADFIVDQAFTKAMADEIGKTELMITMLLSPNTGEECSAFIVTKTDQIAPQITGMVKELGIVIVLILVLTSLGLSFWIYRGVIGPLEQLKKATQNIKDGNLDFTVEPCGVAEINDLCEDFEEMRIRLKETAEEKVEFDKENKELISNISHDLKTPITAVKGYVEGIMDGVADTPEKMDRYIRTIYNKANEMDRLINELTFYSKIDTNRIPYTFSKIHIADYFDDCVEELNLELDAQHVDLTYFNYLEDDPVVIADAEQIKRVINNIVSNSIKYMDKSHKVINIRLRDVGDFVQVEIEDNGKGIATKDLTKIFDRFYRTDASRNSTRGGSGIGLSIVKKILEDHGGKVWATSKEGVGTTMYFVLRKYQEVPVS